MTSPSNTTRSTLGVAASLGVLAAGVVLTARSRYRGYDEPKTDEQQALCAYLIDHLAGSDIAMSAVTKLQETQADRREASLFARLEREFTEERAEVIALLRALGSSPRSIKRAAAHVGKALVHSVAGGGHDDLELFRTVEALCVGVQGKRLLWRTLQRLSPAISDVTEQRLDALERQAVSQWEDLDEFRRSLVFHTFHR